MYHGIVVVAAFVREMLRLISGYILYLVEVLLNAEYWLECSEVWYRYDDEEEVGAVNEYCKECSFYEQLMISIAFYDGIVEECMIYR